MVSSAAKTKPENQVPALSILGEKPEFAWVKMSKLFIDHTYQRTTESRASQRNIENLKKTFSWHNCGVLIVVLDKSVGKYNVLDGQHRMEAAAARGDIDEMPCFIIADIGTAAEAQSFVAINKNRVALSSLAQFHASVAAGDKDALEVSNFLKECDISVPTMPIKGGDTLPRQLQCISVISDLLSHYPRGMLLWIMNIIPAAYGEKTGCMRASFIKALVSFADENGELNHKCFLEVLKKIDVRQFEKEARVTHEMSGKGTIDVMVEFLRRKYKTATSLALESKVMGRPAGGKNDVPNVTISAPVRRKNEDTLFGQVTMLKKAGKTLGQVQNILEPKSNSERKTISDIFLGNVQ